MWQPVIIAVLLLFALATNATAADCAPALCAHDERNRSSADRWLRLTSEVAQPTVTFVHPEAEYTVSDWIVKRAFRSLSWFPFVHDEGGRLGLMRILRFGRVNVSDHPALVVSLLEQGQGALRERASGRVIREVKVGRYQYRCGQGLCGHDGWRYYLPSGAAFVESIDRFY